MTESTPPEGTQLTLVQLLALRRSLTEKVLDKAASDPEWRQLLIDDPELARQEANFPEAQELEQQGPPRGPAEREVVGQGAGWGYGQRGYGYGHGYGASYVSRPNVRRSGSSAGRLSAGLLPQLWPY